MFAAAIKLRISAPDHPRAFRIPGGLLGMLIVAGTGMLGAMVTLVVSFIPPEGINVGSVSRYELTLIVGLMLMCSPPFISSWLKNRTSTLRKLEVDAV